MDHENHFGEQDAGRLTEARVEATLRKGKINHWLALFNENINSEDKSIDYYLKAMEEISELKDKLDEIIHLMNKIQGSNRKILILIKEQMQHF